MIKLKSAQLQFIEETTTHVLESGASFQIPGGWMASFAAEMLTLQPKDSDLHIGVMESGIADVRHAVTKAWTAFSGEPPAQLKSVTPSPAREGWDEIVSFLYGAAEGEMEISALALRFCETWTIVLFHGSVTQFERRRAQIRLLIGSLHPAGYAPESFAGQSAHKLSGDRLGQLTGFIIDAAARAGIAGVGLSLTERDQVIFEGGFGVRDLSQPLPVTADTLFPVASNTKQFTTLLLAKLVSEGVFDWETPVTEVYPVFRLGDPEATRKIQIRHLVSACTGLPRRELDWMFGFEDKGPQRVFDLLGTMKPTTGFGEVFQYSNLLASSAGYIAAHAVFPEEELGLAFETAMSRYVFEPLGMTSSTFDFEQAQRLNHALPHGQDLKGESQRADLDINYAARVLRPALALWSTTRDLNRYLQMELNEGVLPDGTRYIDREALLKRRKAMVSFDDHGSYGMGLIVNRKFGTPVVAHGGSLIGYKSNIFWLPEHGIGGAIVTNSDSGSVVVHTFVRKVLEVLFDARSEAEDDLNQAIGRREKQIKSRLDQLIDGQEMVRDLAGEYSSPDLGKLRVIRDNDAVIFDFGGWQSKVAAKSSSDVASFMTIDPGLDSFDFKVQRKDGARALVLSDRECDYVFSEVGGQNEV